MGVESGTLPDDHYIAPVILFDDSTLLDTLGRLTAHPILVSLGNICGRKRHSHTAWFLLGLIPPYPKTSEEREREIQARMQHVTITTFTTITVSVSSYRIYSKKPKQ